MSWEKRKGQSKETNNTKLGATSAREKTENGGGHEKKKRGPVWSKKGHNGRMRCGTLVEENKKSEGRRVTKGTHSTKVKAHATPIKKKSKKESQVASHLF